MTRVGTVILATALVFGVAAVSRLQRGSPAREVPASVAPVQPVSTTGDSASSSGQPGAGTAVSRGPAGSSPVLLPPSSGESGLVDPGAQPFSSQEGEPMTGVAVQPAGTTAGPVILGIPSVATPR